MEKRRKVAMLSPLQWSSVVAQSREFEVPQGKENICYYTLLCMVTPLLQMFSLEHCCTCTRTARACLLADIPSMEVTQKQTSHAKHCRRLRVNVPFARFTCLIQCSNVDSTFSLYCASAGIFSATAASTCCDAASRFALASGSTSTPTIPVVSFRPLHAAERWITTMRRPPPHPRHCAYRYVDPSLRDRASRQHMIGSASACSLCAE